MFQSALQIENSFSASVFSAIAAFFILALSGCEMEKLQTPVPPAPMQNVDENLETSTQNIDDKFLTDKINSTGESTKTIETPIGLKIVYAPEKDLSVRAAYNRLYDLGVVTVSTNGAIYTDDYGNRKTTYHKEAHFKGAVPDAKDAAIARDAAIIAKAREKKYNSYSFKGCVRVTSADCHTSYEIIGSAPEFAYHRCRSEGGSSEHCKDKSQSTTMQGSSSSCGIKDYSHVSTNYAPIAPTSKWIGDKTVTFEESLGWFFKIPPQDKCSQWISNEEWMQTLEDLSLERFKKDVERLKIQATLGSAAAQYRLGEIYYEGWGPIKQDAISANEWFSKAEAQGYVPP